MANVLSPRSLAQGGPRPVLTADRGFRDNGSPPPRSRPTQGDGRGVPMPRVRDFGWGCMVLISSVSRLSGGFRLQTRAFASRSRDRFAVIGHE